MYLLKKVFQLREHAHPDHEKPFLEHLEDLRVMITRVVITLLISMIVCFTFREEIMEVLRRPVEQVMKTQLDNKLPQDPPRKVTVEIWEEAKAVERASAGLDPLQRELMYLALANPELEFHSRSAALLRAAMVLPEANRGTFVDSLEVPDDLRLQLKALLVTQPSPDADHRGGLRMMSALKPTETFMLSMKLAFFAGVILSFPLLLLFTLQFVLPGLHSNEKRVLWPSMLVGFGLFLSGVCFAYFIVLPRALGFFYEWSEGMGVSNDWRIGEYVGFATTFTLLFGLSFELPVVVMVIVKLGMLTYETMARTRSYAIVAIFITAALITPTPDIFTLILMALPMIVLYEICIWLAYFDNKKKREEEIKEEQEARERMERLLLGQTSQPEPAVEAAVDRSHDPYHADPYHSEHSEHSGSTDHPETGDDGWHEEYPQLDPHKENDSAEDAVNEDHGSPLDPPPNSIPEEEERRRSPD